MILHGDSLIKLKELADNSVDSVVCDPPYELGFMGKAWDKSGIANNVELWREVLRVLKPGGHLLSFGGTRTYHRMVCAIEDAGFEIRDQLQWLYGSGFPKSLNIGKAIDKAAGVEREVIGKKSTYRKPQSPNGWNCESRAEFETAPATDEAKAWSGWGTALKPANEPIVLARKPLAEKTVAENVLKYGTGGLNIDASRIEAADQNVLDAAVKRMTGNKTQTPDDRQFLAGTKTIQPNSAQGRWPANLLLDEAAAEMLDEQTGNIKGDSPNRKPRKKFAETQFGFGNGTAEGLETKGFTDSGGASRFFYVAKASKRERSKGLDKHEMFRVETNECKDANTAAVQLLQRVISESTAKWSIAECGLKISALFPKECRSTIETAINKTIESKILNSLIHSLTNESIQTVNSLTANGGSHAASVANLKEFLLSITNGEMALALGAANAALTTLQSISESAEPAPFNNFHSTVKPVKLMEYLIKLVTPPNGTVLDPFCGSGSTGVAAKRLGFNFIGIELNSEYIQIALKRIEAA